MIWVLACAYKNWVDTFSLQFNCERFCSPISPTSWREPASDKLTQVLHYLEMARRRHWMLTFSIPTFPPSSPKICINFSFRSGKNQRLRLISWASLVAQWLRIHLPMQGTWVRALVREDPTCRGAKKPVHYNYWACALEPACHNYWAHAPQLLKPALLEPVLHNKRSYGNEKPAHRNEE